MRRATPTLLTVIIAMAWWTPAASGDECVFDPVTNRIVCTAVGVVDDPTPPVDDREPDPAPGGMRYVYTTIDPVIGECHYWSNVPGGLDAWDPANDPAVLAAVVSLPECPPPPDVDPEVRGWEVFRSWDLDPPDPTLTPPGVGITGLPTQVDAPEPVAITHDELLPDGRALEVRATVTLLTVAWGDGATTTHDPSTATGHPDGEATHAYALKTCTADYRVSHPSGGLCHPTLDRYTLVLTYTWTGEYRVGGAWITLGTLDRTTTVDYEVDEARGVPIP